MPASIIAICHFRRPQPVAQLSACRNVGPRRRDRGNETGQSDYVTQVDELLELALEPMSAEPAGRVS